MRMWTNEKKKEKNKQTPERIISIKFVEVPGENIKIDERILFDGLQL